MTGRSATRAASSTTAPSTSGRGRISSRIRRSGSARRAPAGARAVGAHGYVQATFLTGYRRHARDLRFLSHAAGARPGAATDVPIDRLAYAALVYVGDSEAQGPCRRREAAVVHHRQQGAAAISQPAGLCRRAGQRGDDEGHGRRVTALGGIGNFGRPMTVEAAMERGIMFAGTPDQVHRADQEILRPCRRLRPSPDHGPGRASSSTTTRCTASGRSRAKSIRASRRNSRTRALSGVFEDAAAAPAQ